VLKGQYFNTSLHGYILHRFKTPNPPTSRPFSYTFRPGQAGTSD
jgi:hypothetical protein